MSPSSSMSFNRMFGLHRNKLFHTALIIRVLLPAILLFAGFSSVEHLSAFAQEMEAYYTIDWTHVIEPGTQIKNPNQRGFGSCICDLTRGLCDPNCCCDPDCSSTQKDTTFTSCLPQINGNVTEMACSADSGDPVRINLPSRFKVANEDKANALFCVVKDNSPVESQYFDVVADISDSSNLQQKLTAYTPRTTLAQMMDAVPSVQSKADMKFGSLVPAVFSSGGSTFYQFGGYFRLPSPVVSSYCEDYSYAGFLVSVNDRQCYRSISNLQTACSTSLNSANYVTDLRIGKSGTATVDNTLTEFVTVGLLNVSRVNTSFEAGPLIPLGTSLPATSYDSGTQVCRNALQEIAYVVTYSDNGRISAVDAYVTIRDVSLIAGKPDTIAQKFSVEWVKDIASLPVRPKSGNPGYVDGLPVPAGHMITTPTYQKAIKQAVDGLTVLGGLSCNDWNREPVRFRENSVSGCAVALTRAELQSICTNGAANIVTSSNNIYAYLEQMSAETHVGRYGDADYNNPDDWIPVILNTVQPVTTWDAINGVCKNLPVGYAYEFLVSKSGEVFNPQMRISGVRRSYILQDWAFKQDGDASVAQQRFWMEWRVNFVTVQDQSSRMKVAPAPSLLPTLPEDIFYPFSLTWGSSSSASTTITITITTLAVVAVSAIAMVVAAL